MQYTNACHKGSWHKNEATTEGTEDEQRARAASVNRAECCAIWTKLKQTGSSVDKGIHFTRS